MRFDHKSKITIALVALCFAAGLLLTQFAISQNASPQAKAPTGQRGGGGMMGADPRAKALTYRFKDADEDMQYYLFVSSKVSKDKKSPLIVTLHGMGAGPSIMVGKQAVDLAEAGGYILVSPMGYNTTGWYGSMSGGMMGGMMGGGRSGAGGGARSGGGMMGGGGGMMGGAGAAGGGGMMGGAGAAGGGANAELVAKRDTGDKSSKGVAGKWLVKDASNDIKLEIKVDGSKFSGTIENSQMPGAIELKDGKIEGDKISFNYVRQLNGQDMKISWTGTLAGDEIKFKREVAGGGGGGMMGGGGARSGGGMMGGGGARSGGGGMMGGMMGGGNSSGKDTNALSEKDVMNVLEFVSKEYKIDEKRIYLMGHSMGGAGTLHLGTKYPDKWAALAAVAPAAFTSPNVLTSIKDKNVPVLIMRGDQDTLIAATVTKPWVDKLKELGITHEYKEIPGVEHGGIITACLPAVYEFFGKYSKK
jgi:predicted esterase